MNAKEFLELVTPEQGIFILAEPYEIRGAKTQPMRHHTFTTKEEMVAQACQLSFETKNVFYALAGYKQAQVWNPNIRNRDGSMGKWQVRTQSNAGWLRALFLDLDINSNPEPDKAGTTYPSKPDAVQALRDFGMKVGLPVPMIVDSGGGIHVYWPFDRDVEVDEWRDMADRFKAICLTEKLRIDPTVPADPARVLRVLGCHNLKKEYARPVALITKGRGSVSPDTFVGIFDHYEATYGALALPKKAPKAYAGLAADDSENNMRKHHDPIDFGMVSFACLALGEQIANRGATAKEPTWRAMLGLAKHSHENAYEAALAVSDGYPGFDPHQMQSKLDWWNAGPTNCKHIHSANPSTCEACPHWGKITSPAQLGRTMDEERILPIAVVDNAGEETGTQGIAAPWPYRVTDTDVSVQTVDPDGNKDWKAICPNPIYPVRVMRQQRDGSGYEETLWRAHLPREGWATMTMPQSLIAEDKGLQKFLMAAGIYVSNKETKELQLYMSAYLKKLSAAQDRERVYPRLGWQGDEHNEGFVLGRRIVTMTGEVKPCHVTGSVDNALKNKKDRAGSLEVWKEAIKLYSDPRYAGHRFFLYMAMGAPIFHMTGHKGMMIHAAGTTGRGKTTCLDACSSIWSHPESLRINGNKEGATGNSVINLLGTYHSLPVLLDEITNRDDEEMASFALNLSQGRGKERMKGTEQVGNVVTWETPVLSTANTDLVTRIFASRKDSQPHMMRVVSVDFELPDTSGDAGNRADQFARDIREHYGWAGEVLMQYVTTHYDKVKERVITLMAQMKSQLQKDVAERFWIAAMVTAVVAGQIARHLKLWDFQIEQDFEWMKEHVTNMRDTHDEHLQTPFEVLAEYLETHIDNTLILSAKSSGNLDNVARAPHRALDIRHEFDKGLIFISRAAIQDHLMRARLTMKEVERELMASGVLLDRNRQKVLGGDTPFAKAQIRCWVVNAAALGPQHMRVVNAAIQNPHAVGQATGT